MAVLYCIKGVLVRVSLKHYNPPKRLSGRNIRAISDCSSHLKSVEVPESNLILWEISCFVKKFCACGDEGGSQCCFGPSFLNNPKALMTSKPRFPPSSPQANFDHTYQHPLQVTQPFKIPPLKMFWHFLSDGSRNGHIIWWNANLFRKRKLYFERRRMDANFKLNCRKIHWETEEQLIFEISGTLWRGHPLHTPAFSDWG